MSLGNESYIRWDEPDDKQNLYVVIHDTVAGHIDAWTVMKINPRTKRTRIIGRELPIKIARKIAKGENHG